MENCVSIMNEAVENGSTNGTDCQAESIISTNIEEEEDVIFLDISLLLENGCSRNDIITLERAGINTVKGVHMCTKKHLMSLKGFDEEKVQKIKTIVSEILKTTPTIGYGLVTALELFQQMKEVFTIPTGSSNFDNILGGGIESMSITEVFGEARTGKTQLAHTLCVTAQISKDSGYNGGKVVFIDTERTFRPGRIKQIAERFNLEFNEVLENIVYARAYNSEHQYELLDNIASKLHEEPNTFKLIIIDSIMSLFRVDFTGSSEMSERQTKLGLLLSKLKKLSEEYNLAIFLTNQITTNMNYTLLNDDLEVKPVGGNVLAHGCTTRVALKVARSNVRIAKLFDSPHLSEQETEFVITNGGIADPKIED